MQQINKALNKCGIHGKNTTSILLGFEKNRILQINDELLSNLTEKSILVTDAYGTEINILEHISNVSRAFRLSNYRKRLPKVIDGLWKADLILGNKEKDRWAAASIKINPISLVNANGIAIGIVPSRWNQFISTSKIGRRFVSNNSKGGMIVCPLLYDNGFMQYFYAAWNTIQQFFYADAKVPHERFLYDKEQLQICEFLEMKRDTPVLELVDDMFTKLTRNSILVPEKKSIITTDIFDSNTIENTNCSIIVPDLIIADSTQ